MAAVGPDPKAGCLGLCAIRPCWSSYTGNGYFPYKTWADSWAHETGKVSPVPSCQALASSGPEKSNWKGHGGALRSMGAGEKPMGREGNKDP